MVTVEECDPSGLSVSVKEVPLPVSVVVDVVLPLMSSVVVVLLPSAFVETVWVVTFPPGLWVIVVREPSSFGTTVMILPFASVVTCGAFGSAGVLGVAAELGMLLSVPGPAKLPVRPPTAPAAPPIKPAAGGSTLLSETQLAQNWIV